MHTETTKFCMMMKLDLFLVSDLLVFVLPPLLGSTMESYSYSSVCWSWPGW